MRENVIEKYLPHRVKEIGGRAYKFGTPGNSGVPDRIVLLPGRQVIFVELKAPGKKSTPVQFLQQKRIRSLGFNVLVIDSKEKVEELIDINRGVKNNEIHTQ
jgi:hypothetical protein